MAQKKVISIPIPMWVGQLSILVLIVISAIVISVLSIHGLTVEDPNAKMGACLLIGATQMISFIIYRKYLEWVWEIKE